MRGTPAEEPQPRIVSVSAHAAAFGAGTLENSRKKFSVVCRAISSSETPARLRQHLGGFDDVGRLVALAAILAGRQIRRVGFDQMRSAGSRRRARAALPTS